MQEAPHDNATTDAAVDLLGGPRGLLGWRWRVLDAQTRWRRLVWRGRRPVCALRDRRLRRLWLRSLVRPVHADAVRDALVPVRQDVLLAVQSLPIRLRTASGPKPDLGDIVFDEYLSRSFIADYGSAEQAARAMELGALECFAKGDMAGGATWRALAGRLADRPEAADGEGL